MNQKKTILALVAGLLVAVSANANRAHACVSYIETENQTDHGLWVTIYDPLKISHLDYGCVAPHASRTWCSGDYIPEVSYPIKGELKDTSDCEGTLLWESDGSTTAYDEDKYVQNADGSYSWDIPPPPPKD